MQTLMAIGYLLLALALVIGLMIGVAVLVAGTAHWLDRRD